MEVTLRVFLPQGGESIPETKGMKGKKKWGRRAGYRTPAEKRSQWGKTLDGH